MLDTRERLLNSDFPAVQRGRLESLQVNLGYKCNLSCTHCHVNAGPNRKELMSRETIDQLLEYIELHDIKTLDLTGGAPELNPDFRYFVTEARQRGVHVMDRCNLTILLEPGQQDLAQFLVDNQVEIVASLPCYTQDNVDAQRGKGVFDGSIIALQQLNALGYGFGDPDKALSLVYNPGGAFLPPGQQQLELDYKEHLRKHFEIEFDQLYTITNMPISRFGAVLAAKGEFENYMDLLRSSFSQTNLDNVMCKSLISIDWQGFVYDCDFNQMLDMPLHGVNAGDQLDAAEVAKSSDLIATTDSRTHISELLSQSLIGAPIVVADHCYGCTAGQGSSCGGALD
jgi:radical SAM/Cys-rich protein